MFPRQLAGFSILYSQTFHMSSIWARKSVNPKAALKPSGNKQLPAMKSSYFTQRQRAVKDGAAVFVGLGENLFREAAMASRIEPIDIRDFFTRL
jgi:hypothetical protein